MSASVAPAFGHSAPCISFSASKMCCRVLNLVGLLSYTALIFCEKKSGGVSGVQVVKVILFNAYQPCMSSDKLTVMLPAISALMGEKTAEPRQSNRR